MMVEERRYYEAPMRAILINIIIISARAFASKVFVASMQSLVIELVIITGNDRDINNISLQIPGVMVGRVGFKDGQPLLRITYSCISQCYVFHLSYLH